MLKPSYILNFEDFEVLRQLIHQHSGIQLSDNKLTFLQIRLSVRLQARNISSAQEYYYFLKYDAQGKTEMQNLIDVITVNETWFFRELGPLQAWCTTVLPKITIQRQQLRLWSVGCASGEEPYSLAMLLLEALPKILAKHCKILATDISHRILKKAKTGIYDMHSLRRTEPYWLKKYFQPTPNNRYKISQAVQEMVYFEPGNLIDPALARRVNLIDIILCRNVMMYLSMPSRQVALTTLYNALKPGGYLILGHSENLIQSNTPFEVTKLGDTIVYRKRIKNKTLNQNT